MADDFFSDGVFDWEDDDDDVEFIDDFEITTEHLSEAELADLDDEWSLHRKRQINGFVNAAYDNDGITAMTELLLAIENNTNWRVEIIADKGGLETMAFYMYDAFEPDMWEHFINSDDYREMVYDITNVSNRKAQIFAEKYLGIKRTLRSRVAHALRRIALMFD